MDDQILTRKTENYLFQEIILPPLLSGESLTISWVPHGGRRRSMIYLAEKADKFNFQKLGKYHIYYIDHNELTEETPAAYFRLILKTINPQRKITDEEESFHVLKQTVEELLSQNFHLVFILGRFDELNFPTFFFNNLYGLWQLNKIKVHFVFATSRNIFREEVFKQYGQLREVLSQNLLYFPICSPEDSQFMIQYLINKYDYRVSLSYQSAVIKTGGGHPSLIKACLRLLNNHPGMKESELVNFLGQQWEIKTILGDIWDSLDEEEKTSVVGVVNGINIRHDQIPSRLLLFRLVTSTKEGSSTLFSPLFEAFASEQGARAQTLTLDPNGGEILVNGLPVKEKITLQEYHLLAAFLEKPHNILSRDQIAEILWGKDSYEKYSDWAIDQIVSQLRKKLERLGVSSKKLQTIRERGYRWTG